MLRRNNVQTITTDSGKETVGRGFPAWAWIVLLTKMGRGIFANNDDDFHFEHNVRYL